MVGDWQLQKTLGAGSMGKVKLATNINTREKVS
jgi:serine/threonine protein kinase